MLTRDSLIIIVKEGQSEHLNSDHKVTPSNITKLDNSVKEGPPMTIEPCKRKRTTPRMQTPKRKDDNFDIVADILKSAKKMQQMK